jgi:hypothetical protein
MIKRQRAQLNNKAAERVGFSGSFAREEKKICIDL